MSLCLSFELGISIGFSIIYLKFTPLSRFRLYWISVSQNLKHVPQIKTHVGWVGVDATRHTVDSKKMLGKERQIEPQHLQDEVHLPPSVMHQSPRDFWKPVVDAGKQAEDSAAK